MPSQPSKRRRLGLNTGAAAAVVVVVAAAAVVVVVVVLPRQRASVRQHQLTVTVLALPVVARSGRENADSFLSLKRRCNFQRRQHASRISKLHKARCVRRASCVSTTIMENSPNNNYYADEGKTSSVCKYKYTVTYTRL